MSHDDRSRAAEFLKNEYARMKHYVRGILAEAADRDSEDIVNEVMARLFEKANVSAPIEDMAAYVYRSLRNNVIDILRRRKAGIDSMDDERSPASRLSAGVVYGPEKMYEKKEIQERINRAIESLPDELRNVFLMNELDGKTFKAIAEETGIPSGTLMARKARAMGILRDTLKDYKNYLED
ncbi:MAG TPA: sigma-70 family RNA polymerase sigma factor [Spirochaetota bacterium]|nr:sigma-70 family RNA polymerase sigma factor [Spirochaetota bacterium]HPI90190.1 sigma-70 family RNA polymerase sigma factor [Spirochaetota bacterium]HPR46341.1 sigma-70 family RNA polymerase sigma factor [Spirochaetota bacterium]